MKSVEELLKKCTVKINIPNEQGSGFFIDNNLIITCAHVVKDTDLADIKVTYQGTQYIPKEVDKHPELDLALVKLASEIEHCCVELNRQVDPFDKLCAYGFPPDSIKTNIALGTAEGINENGDSLTFESETIRPGFSGCPLFNLKTQMVCGVVNQDSKVRLRGNILSGFGGSAIPFKKIFEEYPHLKKLEKKLSELSTLNLSSIELKEAVCEFLTDFEVKFQYLKLFHAPQEKVALTDQYIPIQVTLERIYQEKVNESLRSYGESEEEIKRIYAAKGEKYERKQEDWQEAKKAHPIIMVLADPGQAWVNLPCYA